MIPNVSELPPGLPVGVLMALMPDEQDVYRLAFGSALAEGAVVGLATARASQAIGMLHAVQALAKAFDPNQPRAEDGKWTSGGGSGPLTESGYPLAGDVVDGLVVRENVPNMSSIAASFSDYTILDGIREVPFSHFEAPPHITERTKGLAAEIQQSGEIAPLIVGVDYRGAYVLEGSHRWDALQIAGKTSFPALVVVDNDDDFDLEKFDADQPRDNRGRWTFGSDTAGRLATLGEVRESIDQDGIRVDLRHEDGRGSEIQLRSYSSALDQGDSPFLPPNSTYVSHIRVTPAQRGKGVAAHLYRRAVELAKGPVFSTGDLSTNGQAMQAAFIRRGWAVRTPHGVQYLMGTDVEVAKAADWLAGVDWDAEPDLDPVGLIEGDEDLEKFDPNQARDERGRWSAGGGLAQARLDQRPNRGADGWIWGNSHKGSSAITGRSATIMGIEGYRDTVDADYYSDGRVMVDNLSKDFLQKIHDGPGSPEALYHGFQNTAGVEFKAGDTLRLPLMASSGDIDDSAGFGIRLDPKDNVGPPTVFEFPVGTPMVGYTKWKAADAKEFGHSWMEAIVAGEYEVIGTRTGTHMNWQGTEYQVVSLKPTAVFNPATNEWRKV